MNIKVNANRMNLLKLRRRLKFALRGHKILKDKQEQLTREFNNLIVSLNRLRQKIDTELNKVYKSLKVTYSNYNPELVEQWCTEYSKIEKYRVIIKPEFKFNLRYNTLNAERTVEKKLDGLLVTDPYFNVAIKIFLDIYPKILQLANLEHLCELMADELQTTRRRVNALEYVLIPQIRYSIKFIVNKLNELERTNITQLMRIKQLMQ